MSAIIKREAWLGWVPKPLFTNFYLLLIAPPSLGKKDTVISVATDLLTGFYRHIQNRNMRTMKKLKIVRNEASKQGIMEALKPQGSPVPLYEVDETGNATRTMLIDERGKPILYQPTSEAIIITPELATFIGKETYKEGIIAFLLDIYTTNEQRDYTTQSRGVETMLKMHTVLVGAIQPDVFSESLPKQAAADGFLSRCVIVLEPRATRRRPLPFTPKGAPPLSELARRLAWIAEHTQGEHRLTPEATKYYVRFYNDLMDEIDRYPELAGIKGRMDVMVLKLSLLIKAQRYDDGQTITLEDIQDAGRLLMNTFRKAPDILHTLNNGHDFSRYRSVTRYVASKGEIDRKTLLKNVTRGITATEVSTIVEELHNRGLIDILLDKKPLTYCTNNVKELYVWKGTEDDIPN